MQSFTFTTITGTVTVEAETRSEAAALVLGIKPGRKVWNSGSPEDEVLDRRAMYQARY
jgi:hypothetical protein